MILQMVRNECEIWCTYISTSQLQDLIIGKTKEGPCFAQFALLSRRAALRQLWTQRGLKCLGVKILWID
jgi:hypothetical protein